MRPQDAPSFPPDAFTRPFTGARDGLAWMRAAWPALVALADEAHRGGAHRHAVLLHRVLWRFANNEGRSEVAERLGRQAIASAYALGDDELIATACKWHAGTMLRLCRTAESIEHLRGPRLITPRRGCTDSCARSRSISAWSAGPSAGSTRPWSTCALPSR